MISRVHHHVQQAEPQGAFCSNSILVRASFGFIMTALIKDPVYLLMLVFTLSVLVFLAVLPVLWGVLHWRHGFLCPRVRHSVWQTQGAPGPLTNSWLMFMGFRSKLGVAGGRGKRWTGQRASRTWEALTGLVEGVLCTDMGSSHWCSWSPVRSLLWEKLAWAPPPTPQWYQDVVSSWVGLHGASVIVTNGEEMLWCWVALQRRYVWKTK